MANLYKQAEANTRRTWVYLTFFFIFIILVGQFLSSYLGTSIFVWLAVIYSILMSFLGYWYSDKIILVASSAKRIEKKDNPEVYRLVENLCITAGLPMPKIYIIESSQPNAFATGRNPKHGVVAFTTGLLSKLERAELEGVISHELAHIGNRDAFIGTIVVILVGVVAVMTDLFFRMGFFGGFSRTNRQRDSRGGALIAIATVILAILAPLIATLIRLAISRKREFLADATGALLTRYPEGLASALEKIAKDNHPLHSAHDATAHLYIINPFKDIDRQSWLHKIFMTHPPIEERIKALRGIEI